MIQDESWIVQRLRKANIPEGTGQYEDLERAKKILVGEAIGRGDKRIWERLQGSIREYCGVND